MSVIFYITTVEDSANIIPLPLQIIFNNLEHYTNIHLIV